MSLSDGSSTSLRPAVLLFVGLIVKLSVPCHTVIGDRGKEASNECPTSNDGTRWIALVVKADNPATIISKVQPNFYHPHPIVLTT